ncbi:hypothetical protein [Streptomyces sp. NBC_01601]|uniref:hypothetical protein n=1 Tax=Streptomyces sp. NBC_01601 TaxID=2975892 RepID=UPI002E2C85D7|nr:hypothetical protein [Streptomyces sp. NBC_01601]
MSLFSPAEIDAARQREAARDASLRATTAGEVRNWLAGQDDVTEAAIHPDAPATIAVRLTSGLLMAVTVFTDDVPPAPAAPDTAAHQALAERISSWLAGEAGIDQTWTIPGTTTLGVDLVDGTEFTITVTRRA